MKVGNQTFDFLMILARRSQQISASKLSDSILALYEDHWAEELMIILNKCTVVDDSGRVARNPMLASI